MKQIAMFMIMLALTACHSLGPQSVRESHSLYGEAIATSLNEQFLQNLVRLRYREAPYFLEIGSVTASMSFDAAAGIESALSTGAGADLLEPGLGVGYSNSPTISYTPLRGEAFLRRVLFSVPLETLFALTQSGWKAERVFGICVERINDLENAPSASGPTPDLPPENFDNFERLLELLERVRKKELLRYSIDRESQKLFVQIKSNQEEAQAITEIKKLLGLDPNLDTYAITNDSLERGPDKIFIRTRSMMSILFYLSQTVEAPADHETAGIVTTTRNEDGSKFDWRKTPGGQLFTVHQSRHRPKTAFIAVSYRNHWFYIANNDLDTKSSFMLMTQLFNLNAGAVNSTNPTLTIPVGR